MNWNAIAVWLGLKRSAHLPKAKIREQVLNHLGLKCDTDDMTAHRALLARGASAPGNAALRLRDHKPGAVLGRGKWWTIRAAAEETAELLIYGDIGESWFGESVTAKSLAEQLQAIKAKTINVRINSYGGAVSDGIAIHNALRRHGADIVVDVDGVAFSIASLIAMAGNTVRMGQGSLMMLHAPWGGASGNAEEMRRYADVLDKFAEAMIGAYARRLGDDRVEEIRGLLTDGEDHYYDPGEAVALGLADEITESLAVAASFNLSRYRSLPAAAAAFTHEVTMKEDKPTAPPAAAVTAAASEPLSTPTAKAETPEQVQARVIHELGARNTEITTVFAQFRDRPGVAAIEREVLANASLSVEAARNRLLKHLGDEAGPITPPHSRAEVTADARDKFIAGASQALAAKSGVDKRDEKNEFNGMSLARMAETCLQRAGIRVSGMSNDAVARKVLASMSTTDFPLLLSSTATKALRKAYEEFPSTYNLFCAIGSVSDFKASPRIQLGSFNNLDTKLEGGEYNYGSLSEESESITAKTKGKGIKLTREMIVNDDLGGFSRRAQMLGRAAARTINADVYGLINANGNLSDGGALFNTTAVTTAGGHGNQSGSSTAVTVASISAGRAAMRKQTALGATGVTPRGAVLNIQPRYLLAPVAIEDIVWAVLNSTADPSSSNSQKANYVRDVARLVLVTDPLLDATSATAWYLAADPMDAPLVEVDFLDGVRTPFIDETVDFDTDAMKMKVRLDYGLAAIDYRAGWKNPGA